MKTDNLFLISAAAIVEFGEFFGTNPNYPVTITNSQLEKDGRLPRRKKIDASLKSRFGKL